MQDSCWEVLTSGGRGDEELRLTKKKEHEPVGKITKLSNTKENIQSILTRYPGLQNQQMGGAPLRGTQIESLASSNDGLGEQPMQGLASGMHSQGEGAAGMPPAQHMSQVTLAHGFLYRFGARPATTVVGLPEACGAHAASLSQGLPLAACLCFLISPPPPPAHRA